MLNLLIDTCVWLDVAKDYQRQPVLAVLEELMKHNRLSIILPGTVVDEFARNRSRIAEESGRSLSGVLKRAKEAVERLGDPKKKRLVLQLLNDVDYKIPSIGDMVNDTLARIDQLFAAAAVIERSDDVKLRAAQRAIDKKAPFHRQRNGIEDAVLIEIYADRLKGRHPGERFGFVTHNTKDFSQPGASEKVPHPDIAEYFSKRTSRYYVSLAEALRTVEPELVSEMMIEQEWTEEPRRLTEISDTIGELLDKIWYNRHQLLREKIESGEIALVEKETYPKPYPERTCQRDVWKRAKEAARRVEKKYGLENLGPWDDRMGNAQWQALRPALGDRRRVGQPRYVSSHPDARSSHDAMPRNIKAEIARSRRSRRPGSPQGLLSHVS